MIHLRDEGYEVVIASPVDALSEGMIVSDGVRLIAIKMWWTSTNPLHLGNALNSWSYGFWGLDTEEVYK